MNKYLKLFLGRIIKDFQQKELLPLKLLFFIHASTIYVIYPYLTIHMRELGINVEETAIMSAVTPVVSILMPPLAGLIADKIGNFKILLALFSALGGGSALLLMVVPVGRVTVIYPDTVVMGLSCHVDSQLGLSLYEDHICIPKQNDSFEANLTIQSCGFVCHAYATNGDSEAIVQARSYGVQMHDIKANSTITATYRTLPAEVLPKGDETWITRKVLKNDERFTRSVRKLSNNSYFFPTPMLYNFSCGNVEETQNTNLACVFGAKDQLSRLKNGFKYKMAGGLHLAKQTEDDIAENRKMFDLQWVGYKDSNPVCIDSYPKNKEYISVNVPLYNTNDTEPYKTLDLGSCAPRCLVTTSRQVVCSNQKEIVELDIKLTFWSYMAVRVFIGMISGTAFAMFEGAVIAILREHHADYGLQRIYATIGGMMSSPLSGWLIDFASQGKEYTDFRPIFFLYASLKLVSAILILFMNLEFKSPANNVISDVFSVLKKIELIALLIACFVLGTAWGYIESFLFWLIQDLGGTKSLMGITITVGGVAGIPLLVLSGPIIKRIGHANVLFIGFIFYAIRLLGYSLIYNPWMCLIFEAMESITSSLSFTAAVTYAAKLSSITTDTSIQGLLGGIYYGVGKGSGSLIGGYSMKAFGTRTTYRIFAVGTAVTGIFYFLFNHFYMKHRTSDDKDITYKDPPVQPASIDLNAKIANGINPQNRVKDEPLSFEDALTNLGYEDTEEIETTNSPKVNGP